MGLEALAGAGASRGSGGMAAPGAPASAPAGGASSLGGPAGAEMLRDEDARFGVASAFAAARAVDGAGAGPGAGAAPAAGAPAGGASSLAGSAGAEMLRDEDAKFGVASASAAARGVDGAGVGLGAGAVPVASARQLEQVSHAALQHQYWRRLALAAASCSLSEQAGARFGRDACALCRGQLAT